MRRELEALARADAVDPDRERPRGGDRRVLLAQRAGGGVARVRRGFCPRRRAARSARGSRRAACRPRRAPRAAPATSSPSIRSGIDAIVRRLTVTSSPSIAVAARRAADEDAVLVGEVDREPVDLRLDHVRDGLVAVEPLADVVGPLHERLVGRHLLERAHRLEVPHLLELLGRRRADALGRRVGRDELGMLAARARRARRRAGRTSASATDGSSRTWYSYSQRLSSVAQLGGARARSEDGKQLLRRVSTIASALARARRGRGCRPSVTPTAYSPPAFAAACRTASRRRRRRRPAPRRAARARAAAAPGRACAARSRRRRRRSSNRCPIGERARTRARRSSGASP